jgi:hypothetical protein
VERVPLGLSLYHVHAASTDVVRITLYTGGRHECEASAHADDDLADRKGGIDGTHQSRDVKVAGAALRHLLFLKFLLKLKLYC